MMARYRLVLAALLGSVLIARPMVSAAADVSGDEAAPGADLALIRQVMRGVEHDYLRPVGSEELTTDALKGMLSRLDPHSSYMDESEYLENEAEMRGRFGGIGIEISEVGGVPQVISPMAGTPAARAGIEPGDFIVAVDGQTTRGMESGAVVKSLRGKPGSKVILTILRGDRAPFAVTLMRAVIEVKTVTAKLEPNDVGFIRISRFDENTADAVTAALETLERRAGRLRGLVLDLRDDPGGLLDSAVAVAGDFLDGGTVVSTRGRQSDDDEVYRAPESGDRIPGTPMVVLINNGSASAAEIVAGALQDRRRATVMGTQSFGKGSVQSILPLDGKGALRLTTALYYTPSGRSIQGIGISPNIFVPAPEGEQVPNAVVTRESQLRGAFAPASATPAAVPARDDSPPIAPRLIGTSRDDQLKTALAYFEREMASRQHLK